MTNQQFATLLLLPVIIVCTAISIGVAFVVLSSAWRAVRSLGQVRAKQRTPSERHITACDGFEHDVLPLVGGPLDGFTADDAGDTLAVERAVAVVTLRCDICGVEQTMTAAAGERERITPCTCGEEQRFSIENVDPQPMLRHWYSRTPDAYVFTRSQLVDDENDDENDDA